MKSEEAGDLHINQFNTLFNKGVLLDTVVNTPSFEISGLRLSFDGLEIHRPFKIQKRGSKDTGAPDHRMLPKECREQSLTYGGSIFLKVKLEYRGNVVFNEYRDAGVLPVMLRSCMCNLSDIQNLYEAGEDPREPGGYFIVDGYDRMVRFHVAQKRNFVFVHKKKSKDSAYTDYSVSIRSVSEEQIGQKNEIKYCVDGNMHFKVYVNKRVYLIPVALLLRALVNCTDEEIFIALGSDQRVLAMLAGMKEYPCYSQKECWEYIGARFKSILKIEDHGECGRLFIDSVILPHLNKSEDKYLLIIEAIKKLLRCYDGKIQPDDADAPSNFELYTELQLIPICFREKLSEIKRSFMMKIMYFLRNKVSTTDSTTSFNVSEAAELAGELSDSQLEKIKKHFESLDFDIGAKVKKFLSTGNITTVCCSDLLQNSSFTVLAERINLWRFTSHFASVSRGAYFSNLKITSVRKLRPETWGFFCPVNTPDGAPCGLLFHLSQSCFVSDKSYVFDDMILYDFGVVPPHRGCGIGVPVFYNGKLCGTTGDPASLARSLREHRAKNDLCFEVCYEYGKGIDELVCIFDSYSSLYRKVFNVKLQKEEWIGLKEQVFLDIRLARYATKDAYSKYDREAENDDAPGFEYREIDNMNIFSSIAACIPFSDHNPSPRNMYQCQMAKQAMGIACFNQQFRTDGKNFLVSYLQAPMVRTSAYGTFEGFPIGFNCIVAVVSYTAYDMEDAVVINKSSTERGLFGAFIYKNEKFELERNSHIDFTPFKGARIEADDVLVRYTHPDLGTKTIKYHGTEPGFVETVRIFGGNVPCVTITLRIQRNPTIGDKFCSRHGQKGVCSMLWQEVDMPFTEYGLRPDIIINPHAFPSRMTIGMLLESICGKSAMALGKTQDASPFVKNAVFDEGSPRSIGEELKKCGFNYYGNEPMYSGITGTEFATDIFIGPVYYQRLRHMVEDKYQVRTSGAVVASTRQPVGGRKNKGGIRFGEMEKDALIAHGTSFALQDRLMNCSDRAEFTYCSDCRTILFTGKGYCSCGSKNLKKVVMPYVFKYLCCELLSMNVKLAFDV